MALKFGNVEEDEIAKWIFLLFCVYLTFYSTKSRHNELGEFGVVPGTSERMYLLSDVTLRDWRSNQMDIDSYFVFIYHFIPPGVATTD